MLCAKSFARNGFTVLSTTSRKNIALFLYAIQRNSGYCAMFSSKVCSSLCFMELFVIISFFFPV